MADHAYLMESDEEAFRLDLKTNSQVLETQALWAGIKPGMRVADIGCGSGRTTFFLNKLIQPGGQIVGVDSSDVRLNYAREHYSDATIEYVCKDIIESLDDLDHFDFIWSRFLLEYFRSNSFDVVKNFCTILKPGGILCLIDLDCNCLRIYGLTERLQNAVVGILNALEKNADFDPYVGLKLYSYLYDLKFEDIDVTVSPHNLIFGQLKEADAYNWTQKVKVAAKNSGYPFDEYPGGFGEFLEEFKISFADPRRFTYTPLICCRGKKSLS
jgi:SAM-dependent methyltransferase